MLLQLLLLPHYIAYSKIVLCEGKTRRTPPLQDWKLLQVQLGKTKSPHTHRNVLDLKAFQNQPCRGNGISLLYNLEQGHSLSVFKNHHSQLSCCLHIELNSTTVLPSKVGREGEKGDAKVALPSLHSARRSFPITPIIHHLQSFQAPISLSLNLTLNYSKKAYLLLLETTGHFNIACFGNR